MPYSNFPGGFPNGVTIRGIPILQTNPGRVFWVSSATTGLLPGHTGGSNGNSGTFRSPFATVAYAVTQCSANSGDIIFVKPGHAETVSDATTFAMNVAGVAVVGLGYGTSRPTFTLDTGNGSTVPVSANNITFQNCIFTANFLSIAACFTLTTAKWFTLQNCFFNETSGIKDFLNIVKSTGAANTVDGLTCTDNAWYGQGTTSVNSFVLTANDIDSCTLQRNNITLLRTATAAALMTVTAGVLTNLDCGFNRCATQQTAVTGGGLINVGGTTSTGIVYNNYFSCIGAGSTDVLVTTSVGVAFFENRFTDTISATGFVIPAVDS